MNAVTKKAERLLESDVHAAIEAMIEANEKPSALNLLKVLGRGSLTTISKYLASFNSANDEGKTEASPPALIDLPHELGLSGELLIKKIWTDARALANQEIESQRVALTQAEAEASAKITEAMEFSELQAKRIEELENIIDELNKGIEQKDKELKEQEKNRQSLELQVSKNQIILDHQANNLESIKNELANCKKDCKKSENLAAILTGKLEVYEKQKDIKTVPADQGKKTSQTLRN